MSDPVGKPYKCTSGDGTIFVAHLYEDSAEVIVQEGKCNGVYYSSADVSKPDAIDLGRRILEHFEVMPTKEEIEIAISSLEDVLSRHPVTKSINGQRQTHGHDIGPSSWQYEHHESLEATIAKLRRLVGEGESDG